MTDERLAPVPKILETPKGDDPTATDSRMVALLRATSAASRAGGGGGVAIPGSVSSVWADARAEVAPQLLPREPHRALGDAPRVGARGGGGDDHAGEAERRRDHRDGHRHVGAGRRDDHVDVARRYPTRTASRW
jgi:hypothetical protein